MEGFTESLKLEVQPFGIEIVLVEPGPIKTNATNSFKFAKNSPSTNSAFTDLNIMVKNMMTNFTTKGVILQML